MAKTRTLEVQVTGDASSLNRSLRSANAQLEKFGKQSSLSGRLSSNGFSRMSVAARGATAGVAGLAAGATYLIKQYEESAKVGRQTAAVIKSTGGAANVSAKQVQSLATAISNKTGIDDEAIASGENLLLTFTNISNEAGKGNKIFSEATRVITDMSVALGQDMKSSAIQVGKALNDPIKGLTALQRVGVSFTSAQKEQIKTLVDTGHGMQAQKRILRELNREFGGSAAAAATPFAKLKVTLGNLAETIGGYLAPRVERIAAKLNVFVKQMMDGTGQGGRFVKTLKNIADAVIPIAKMVGDAAKQIGSFAAKHRSVTQLAAAFVGVGLAIKGLRFASAATGFTNLISAGKTASKLLRKTLVTEAAAGGAEAGVAAAAGARSTGPMAAMAASGKALGVKFGTAFKLTAGIAIGAVIADALANPDTAGLSPDEEKRRLQQAVREGKAGVTGSLGYSPENLMKLPKLTKGPRAATGGAGKLIGQPFQGTHGKAFNVAGGSDNWQSENAVDIAVTVGTPILAVEGGQVSKVTLNSGTGRFAGSAVTIHGFSGNSYYYAHLSSVSVKAGQKIGTGDQIGRSGSANGVAHLHFAVEKGDPRTLRVSGSAGAGSGGFAVNKLTSQQQIVYAAAKKYGIDPAILWGVYGQESQFGKNMGPSSAGALGPFQLMPDTAKGLGVDPMNFRQAAYGAARYLSQYKNRGTAGMLAAYNAGPQGNPNNAQTRAYIPGVLNYAKQWGTVQDGQVSTDPTSWRDVAEKIAAGILRPIAQRLRAGLGPIIGSLGRSDTQLTRYGGRMQVLDARLGSYNMDNPADRGNAADDLLAKRNLIFARGYVEGQKRQSLDRAARKYSSAIKQLKSKYKSAPAAQKSFINQQIKRYQARLREIQSESRDLGVQIQVDASDLKSVTDEFTALTTPKAPDFVGGVERRYDLEGIGTALTPGLEDDRALAQKRVTFAQRNYDAAVRLGNTDAQMEWGQKLVEATNALKDLDQTIADEAERKRQEAFDWADADLALAGLTDSLDDDRAALGHKLELDRAALEEAKAANDPRRIAAAAAAVKADTEALKSLDDTIQQENEQRQKLIDLTKQQVDNQLKIIALAGQGPELVAAIIAAVNGGIGGSAGLGFQSVSYAGANARYG
jgi:murein DD-endopeptidase MepM/ murein hydrolase activator NlpD